MNETTEIKNAIGVVYAFKKYKLKYENMVEDFADDEYKTACEMILILEKWLKNEDLEFFPSTIRQLIFMGQFVRKDDILCKDLSKN